MYHRLVNTLRGQVSLQIESPCPERMVNLCGVHAIPFWRLRWQDETHCTLRTTRRGLQKLRQVTGETPCTIRVTGESGVPVTCRRLRRRYVLLSGLALLTLLLLWGSLYIWEFRVTGNDAVPTQTILRALEASGVRVGKRSRTIDPEALRNHVLQELHDVAWFSVNIRGCVAHIQVVERHRPPPRVEEHTLTNVIARHSGIVTRVSALDGAACVTPGDTVTEGQLLISGVVDSTRHGQRFLHGMGSVEGRTWPEITVWVPLEQSKCQEARKRQFYALDFGKNRIKFYAKGRKIDPECDKITRYRPWTLPGGLRLPFTWVTETVTTCTAAPQQRTVKQARAEGEAAARALLYRRLGDTGKVVRERFTTLRRDGWLVVTLHSECLEELGQEIVLPAPEWNDRAKRGKD